MGGGGLSALREVADVVYFTRPDAKIRFRPHWGHLGASNIALILSGFAQNLEMRWRAALITNSAAVSDT